MQIFTVTVDSIIKARGSKTEKDVQPESRGCGSMPFSSVVIVVSCFKVKLNLLKRCFRIDVQHTTKTNIFLPLMSK